MKKLLKYMFYGFVILIVFAMIFGDNGNKSGVNDYIEKGMQKMETGQYKTAVGNFNQALKNWDNEEKSDYKFTKEEINENLKQAKNKLAAELIKETETALENYEVGNAEEKIKKTESLSPNNKQLSELKEKLEEKQKIISQIGEKPENSTWDAAVRPVTEYLETHLKDPDSVEYIEWSPVHLYHVEGKPYWRVRAKYRAKNSFGGYVVEEKLFYMRHKQVMTVEKF